MKKMLLGMSYLTLLPVLFKTNWSTVLHSVGYLTECCILNWNVSKSPVQLCSQDDWIHFLLHHIIGKVDNENN